MVLEFEAIKVCKIDGVAQSTSRYTEVLSSSNIQNNEIKLYLLCLGS